MSKAEIRRLTNGVGAEKWGVAVVSRWKFLWWTFEEVRFWVLCHYAEIRKFDEIHGFMSPRQGAYKSVEPIPYDKDTAEWVRDEYNEYIDETTWKEATDES